MPQLDVNAQVPSPNTLFFLVPRVLLSLVVNYVILQEPHINDARPRDSAACRRSTMPSEDFFNLIQHLQSTRIEDQRSPLPVPLVAN